MLDMLDAMEITEDEIESRLMDYFKFEALVKVLASEAPSAEARDFAASMLLDAVDKVKG